MIATTPAKILLGAAIGLAVLTGCNKKPDDIPAPTAKQLSDPTSVPDPDLTKPSGDAGGSGNANPGGKAAAPATPMAPDANSTAQPPSSTTSTNQ